MHGRLAALVLPLLLAGCIERDIVQDQTKRALVSAGLSAATSQCIAHRLTDRLTGKQLRKLERLQGPRRSAAAYLAALQRVNDPQLTRVTISAAVLCAAGWDR